jgi:hypothetical protein
VKVIILGCGPAGLLAAHAARQAALDTTIYSIKEKSVMPGAQFLHEPIPGVTSATPDASAMFIKVGPKAGYAQKVYGSPDAPTSWDGYPAGERPIWSMGAAYDTLWELYNDLIVDADLNRFDIESLTVENPDALMISTIPAWILCQTGRHVFRSKSVWIRSRQTDTETNCVVYNGNPLIGYYRASNLFGWEATEFGHQVPGALKGEKPLGTDCDCQPEIHRLGRFGTWSKGVLIHHAYSGAKELIVNEVERRGRRLAV